MRTSELTPAKRLAQSKCSVTVSSDYVASETGSSVARTDLLVGFFPASMGLILLQIEQRRITRKTNGKIFRDRTQAIYPKWWHAS